VHDDVAAPPAPAAVVPVDVEISIVDHENREMVRTCLRTLPDACRGLA